LANVVTSPIVTGIIHHPLNIQFLNMIKQVDNWRSETFLCSDTAPIPDIFILLLTLF